MSDRLLSHQMLTCQLNINKLTSVKFESKCKGFLSTNQRWKESSAVCGSHVSSGLVLLKVIMICSHACLPSFPHKAPTHEGVLIDQHICDKGTDILCLLVYVFFLTFYHMDIFMPCGAIVGLIAYGVIMVVALCFQELFYWRSANMIYFQ